MEGILKFDLTDYDDDLAHRRCLKSLDMAIVLFNIQGILRNYVKNSETNEVIEKLQEEILNEYEKQNINLSELIV